MCSDKLKMCSYKSIYQSMKMFRSKSNDPQSTMFITDTVHLVIYVTRILFMTAFITPQLLLLLARDKICRARYAIARASVHLSKGWMTINQKRLVNIVKFSPHATSFCGISFMQKFWWISLSEGVKQGWGWNDLFSSFVHLYLENGTR